MVVLTLLWDLVNIRLQNVDIASDDEWTITFILPRFYMRKKFGDLNWRGLTLTHTHTHTHILSLVWASVSCFVLDSSTYVHSFTSPILLKCDCLMVFSNVWCFKTMEHCLGE